MDLKKNNSSLELVKKKISLKLHRKFKTTIFTAWA